MHKAKAKKCHGMRKELCSATLGATTLASTHRTDGKRVWDATATGNRYIVRAENRRCCGC